MATDEMDINSALCSALAERIGKQRVDLWFGANTRLSLRGDRVEVDVANQFLRDWLRNNFRVDIEACAKSVTGRAAVAEFRVEESLANPSPSKPRTVRSSDDEVGSASENSSPENSSPKMVADAKSDRQQAQPHTSAARRQYAQFSSLVAGHANRIARASAETVAHEPGRLTPLFFHGPTGVGKTHLLEAIRSEAMARQPRARVVYLSSEEFTISFLDALHGSGLPNFRRKYRGLEMLLLDDVQFFVGKQATISEFLHTIDTLLMEGRQIVLAADRPPSELTELGADLCGRLSGGMVSHVGPPDREMRRKIVKQHAERLELDLPDNVEELIASRFTEDVRTLFGAVNRLHATSRALAEPITRGMAEESFADLLPAIGRVVKLPDIERAVCDVFGLEPASLRSEVKKRSVSQPRMLAMWLARKYTRSALSEIGGYFGRRSHTTVISANKRVDGWLAQPEETHVAGAGINVQEAVKRVELKLRVG